MKKVLFFILTTMTLVACEQTGLEPNSKICSGYIIGTLGCCDENYTTFYKGYFIATNDKDTILSFNIDVKDSIDVISGTHRISDREIPYSFYVTFLTPSDKRYIHFVMPVSDHMHQPVTISKTIDEIPQTWITPCK